MSPEQARAFLDSLSPEAKEQAKKLLRHAMDVAYRQAIEDNSPRISIGADEYKSIRAICGPEVKP